MIDFNCDSGVEILFIDLEERNQLEKDKEIDPKLLYSYMKLQKKDELEKAKDIEEVREELT